MRLVYESTGAEVKVGDMVKIGKPDHIEEVRVDFFREPHKTSSSGRVTIMYPDGDTAEYYVGVIGAEWIEREDRAAEDALHGECKTVTAEEVEAVNTAMMRNGKPLKTVPDGSPRRMADGKNAWRKMSDEQRFEFLRWITHGNDAPVTDAAHEINGHALPNRGEA